MNLLELDAALRKLRLSGMADVLEARLRQAQSERQTPIDLVSALVGDELVRRQDRLITRRIQQARFRDIEQEVHAAGLVLRSEIGMVATSRSSGVGKDQNPLGPVHECLGFSHIGAR